ncbi:MAG: hypothetical protein Q8L34_04980 [Candidatus Woesearchaeota archaeon]|nr:hypothetical protein [Candidatus Woesearchaeota archaeon]
MTTETTTPTLPELYLQRIELEQRYGSQLIQNSFLLGIGLGTAFTSLGARVAQASLETSFARAHQTLDDILFIGVGLGALLIFLGGIKSLVNSSNYSNARKTINGETTTLLQNTTLTGEQQ